MGFRDVVIGILLVILSESESRVRPKRKDSAESFPRQDELKVISLFRCLHLRQKYGVSPLLAARF